MKHLRIAAPVATVIAAAAALGVNLVSSGTPASAQTVVIHTTDDVNIRQQPTANSPRVGGIAKGTALTSIDCAISGQNIDGVSVWMHVTVGGVSGFYASYYDDSHYTNWADLQAKYGIPQCGAAASAPPPAATTAPAQTSSAPAGGVTVNGLQIGSPTGPVHAWGSCQVRDYTGASYGHVIVSYTAGTHVVRNGMLWGWFDNGGAPGALGCPTGDEYGFGAGVRQNFQRGALVWAPGLDHAVVLRSGPSGVANAGFATWMLGYAPGGVNGSPNATAIGAWLGQCRDAVDKDVQAVAGLTLGALNAAELADYNAGYRRLNAYRVPVVGLALPGDIVNIGNGVHTYVVVRNLGGGRLEVVDSNHDYHEHVMHYIREYDYRGYASSSTIWRLGQV